MFKTKFNTSTKSLFVILEIFSVEFSAKLTFKFERFSDFVCLITTNNSPLNSEQIHSDFL